MTWLVVCLECRPHRSAGLYRIGHEPIEVETIEAALERFREKFSTNTPPIAVRGDLTWESPEDLEFLATEAIDENLRLQGLTDIVVPATYRILLELVKSRLKIWGDLPF